MASLAVGGVLMLAMIAASARGAVRIGRTRVSVSTAAR